MFTWRVIYKDGSVHNYDPNNYDISHVDQDKLDLFQIKDVEGEVPLLNIHFDDPRKRLIYVRRNEMHSTLPYPITQHLVGWQMKVGGENIQSICHVFETIIVNAKDNTRRHMAWIEMAGKFDKTRDSHFKEPTAKQLSIIGSKST